MVLFVDPGASPEQVTALVTILSGQAGGMPWEAIAATIEKFEGFILRPIEIRTNGQRGHVRIAGATPPDRRRRPGRRRWRTSSPRASSAPGGRPRDRSVNRGRCRQS